MASSEASDKYSIKTLLFQKPMPNYEIPVPTEGYKVYPCIDCGDKFMFESSYNYHVNRRSMDISYTCRHCGKKKLTFYNRCNLLCHIRSHNFKTATINVNDLKVNPLPLAMCSQNVQRIFKYPCSECSKYIFFNKNMQTARSEHFNEKSLEVYTCCVCLYSTSTLCALRAHVRIHLKKPPYFCPNCGIGLTKKCLEYPYSHQCQSFNMMRATSRSICPVKKAHVMHPSKMISHLNNEHVKQVYKCGKCDLASFDISVLKDHYKLIHDEILEDSAKCITDYYYQCDLCPGHLISVGQITNHMKSHYPKDGIVYPCWTCNTIYNTPTHLIIHHSEKHADLSDKIVHTTTNEILKLCNPNNVSTAISKSLGDVCRVLKQCYKCGRNFTYVCKYKDINSLPSECPFKCNIESDSTVTCNLCQNKMSEDWEDVKVHFSTFHTEYKCLDLKVKVTKLDLSTLNNKGIKRGRIKSVCGKKNKKKSTENVDQVEDNKSTGTNMPDDNGSFCCPICQTNVNNKNNLEDHLKTHKDPCMAYQCMECGKNFVVKPSFTTHLLLEHNIPDVDNYISEKNCYNEDALIKYQIDAIVNNEPLKENQCKVCREQFHNPEELEKHFRVHGMAFLMKTSNKGNSP